MGECEVGDRGGQCSKLTVHERNNVPAHYPSRESVILIAETHPSGRERGIRLISQSEGTIFRPLLLFQTCWTWRTSNGCEHVSDRRTDGPAGVLRSGHVTERNKPAMTATISTYECAFRKPTAKRERIKNINLAIVAKGSPISCAVRPWCIYKTEKKRSDRMSYVAFLLLCLLFALSRRMRRVALSFSNILGNAARLRVFLFLLSLPFYFPLPTLIPDFYDTIRIWIWKSAL